MTRFTVWIGLFFTAAAVAGQVPPQAPPPRPVPIDVLVKQLASGDYQEREAATRRLSALTVDPPPELLAATRSENPEVRARAGRAVLAIQRTRTETRMGRGQRFAAKGQVDLFVAATASWDLPSGDSRLWEPVHNIGRRLFVKSEMSSDRRPHNCPSSFPDYDFYPKNFGPRFTLTDRPYTPPDPQKEDPPILFRHEAIMAPGVITLPGQALFGGLIVSRGTVETSLGIDTSVVLANGDVTAVTGLLSCIIVCDGDVIVTKRHLSKSIVIARGNITTEGGANSCYLAAGGKVTIKQKLRLPPGYHNEITEGTAGALGVTFFELADVGVEAKAAGATVTVTSVAERKAFAEAGVRAGDVIAFVNGKTPISVESFRRLLRDALAIGDATITLRHGNATLTVTVALPE